MRTKAVNVYAHKPPSGVDNRYATSEHAIVQPALWVIVGQRTAGKSYLAHQIISQSMADKTFDRVYMVTPSFNSNQAYFGAYVRPENVFEPDRGAVASVISAVEADRDDWEAYVEAKKRHADFMRRLQAGNIDPESLTSYFLSGAMDPPKWKYETEQPPRSCVILDDILGSAAVSPALTKVATLNRHIAPLRKPWGNRSACGLAVLILTQTYRMQGGIGRALRENVSALTLFENRQQKQMDVIREELANVCDEDDFQRAFDYATREKYGNLTVDFHPKKPEYKFRKNLREYIILE